MERISMGTIRRGIEKSMITFEVQDGLLAARIGEYWFYVGPEGSSVEDFDIENEELAGMVYEAVNSEPVNGKEDEDASECLYYKAVLEEQGAGPIVKAEYVSVWDGGIRITAACKVNLDIKKIFDIETVNVEGLDILEREYVVINGCEHDVEEERELLKYKEGRGLCV